VGVHSNGTSHHQGLPQRRNDAFQQRFPFTPALASIFVALNFSSFATESPSEQTLRPAAWDVALGRRVVTELAPG
jgi:hypothetical protein